MMGMKSERGVRCVRRVRGVRPVIPVRCVKSFKVSISAICLYVLYTYSYDIPPGISYQFFMPPTANCFGFWKKYFSVYIKELVVKPKKLMYQNVEVFVPIRPISLQHFLSVRYNRHKTSKNGITKSIADC